MADSTNNTNSPVTDIAIRDESIRLGQLLKLANIVASGADVKALLGIGEIEVNGQQETRRGRTLVPGDIVSCGNVRVRVTSTET